jgi:predicted nucleotidyltransferase
MPMYTLAEVQYFLRHEKIGLHGTSEIAYAQNRAITETVQRVGDAVGDAILGVQLLGSRAHGTSAPESDVELAVVRSLELPPDKRAVPENLQELLQGLGMPTDVMGAKNVEGIASAVPVRSGEFISWVRGARRRTIPVFEEGIFCNDDLKLAGLAAVSVIMAMPEARAFWSDQRSRHARAYLGRPARMRDKLSGRLAEDPTEVYRAISDDFIRQRWRLFGLPDTPEQYYDEARAWFDANKDVLQGKKYYALYQNVVRRLRKGNY